MLQCLIGIHRVQGALIEFRKLVFYTLLLGQEDFAAPVDVAVGCERQFRYLVEDHVQPRFRRCPMGLRQPFGEADGCQSACGKLVGLLARIRERLAHKVSVASPLLAIVPRRALWPYLGNPLA